MALDHALAERLDEGTAVFRLYGWRRPTISLGRNEPADPYRAAVAEHGLELVRRPTGGRAVVHHREVTYAVVLPRTAMGGPRSAYAAINRGLVVGLRRLGVDAEVSAVGVVAGPDAGPCFAAPAPGEVTAAGRKLIGSAQVRVGQALLQHGSLLLANDQTTLADRSGGADGPNGPGGSSPATLAELMGRQATAEEVRHALTDGVKVAWGGTWVEGAYRPQELEAAARLEDERYRRDEWTWRR